MKTPLTFAAILSLSAASASAQEALRIEWGSSLVSEKIITSDGSAVTLDEFSFELGGFAGGFVPTAENINEWLDNWQVFDAITENDPDRNGTDQSGQPASADFFIPGGGTDARFVAADLLDGNQNSLSADSNGTDTFGPGQQAYVFIRNSETTTAGSEWLLYTSEAGEVWEYPTVTSGQTQVPLTWYVAEADEAIWGGVNGSTLGGGEFSDSSSDFVLRTHTFIPEPSVALFSALSGLLLLVRRSRA
ncbi:MAG: hypothetical protein Q7Q71_03395 [Verrucomicrobiota bacterium JB023]|nr:hypothetical protein [Verrucomicrobiota bacterium JB023]